MEERKRSDERLEMIASKKERSEERKSSKKNETLQKHMLLKYTQLIDRF